MADAANGTTTNSHQPAQRRQPGSNTAGYIDEMQVMVQDLRFRYEAVTVNLRCLQERALCRGFRPPQELLRTTDDDEKHHQQEWIDKNILLLHSIGNMQQSQLLLSERLEQLELILGRTTSSRMHPTSFPPLSSRMGSRPQTLSPNRRNSLPSLDTDSLRSAFGLHASRALTQQQQQPQHSLPLSLLSRKRAGSAFEPTGSLAKKRRDESLPKSKNPASEKKETTATAQLDVSTLQKSRPPVPMAVATDQAQLSPLQVHIRNSLEFFQCTNYTCPTTTATRSHKKVIRPFQVGIRCKYCAHIPLSERRKASESYPRTLLAIYRAAQNIATTHLLDDAEEGCPYLPQAVREELEIQRPQRDASNVGVSYWVDTCQEVGVVEAEGALWFASSTNDAPEASKESETKGKGEESPITISNSKD